MIAAIPAIMMAVKMPWDPPPAPPSPPDEDYLEQDLLTLATLVAGLLVAVIFYVRSHWTTWFDQLTLSAFKDVDRDASGNIDRDETYLCVVCLYLTLNEYGVKCCAPDREAVKKIFDATDSDKSGRLDYNEFRKAIFVLGQQTAGRFIFQLVGTIMCPILAHFILEFLEPYLPAKDGILPNRVIRVATLVPDAFPTLILSAVIFMQIWDYGTGFVDWLSEYGAKQIGAKKEGDI